MSPPAAAPSRPRTVLLVWLLLVGVFVSVALPRAASPGLYYDEAFFAQQAKDFFEPERGHRHPPSTREIALLGRPFPLRNALYLGSLKSQLLIPAFAVFGSGVEVLRLSTAATGLLALLLLMLWADRLLGWPSACAGGVLALADPSCWFFSLYEWGPFTTLLLCRAAGLYFVTTGWMGRRGWRIALGGFSLGLGVFARADFAALIAALGAALLAVRPGVLGEAWRRGRGDLATLGISLLLGAAPMLVSVGGLVQMMDSPVLARRGDLGEKLQVLGNLVSGSRFYQIMEEGGRFEHMAQVEAPWTLFGPVALGACVLTALGAARRRRAGEPLGAREFLLAAGLLVTAATVVLPGAVRAHHLLNGFPFFHLLVGATAVGLVQGRSSRRGRRLAASAVALVAMALLASDARVIAATYGVIERTGGRGRFTDALAEPARWLESQPASRGISLDWGFHEPLLFLTHRAQLLEPIWDLRSIARSRGRWRFPGRPGDLYFAHDRDYDLFGFGPAFLAAARELAESAPDAVVLRRHADREGELAFWSVRLERPHHLVFQRGRFDFELRGSAPAAAASGAARELHGSATPPARDPASASANTRFP